MASTETKLAVYSAMSRFLDSKDLSDFTITSNGTTWHVHRLLLCLHSDVFAKWCNGEFEEAKKGQVDLSDHECEHIDALIKYLYTFEYDVSDDTLISDDLVLHTNMCIIADKERSHTTDARDRGYNIQGLKSLSTSYFQDLIDAELEPYDLAAAVAVAYETAGATAAIREVLVAEIVGNQQHFLPNEPTEDSEELEEAISAYPDFALEIIKAKGNRQGTEERRWLEYKCPKCRGSFQAPYSEKHDVLYACRFCNASMDGKSWQKHVRPYI